jgi:hypothetical protein
MNYRDLMQTVLEAEKSKIKAPEGLVSVKTPFLKDDNFYVFSYDSREKKRLTNSPMPLYGH